MAATPADVLVRLRGDPSLATELKRASIDVVTLANNHAFDFGLPGMRDTIAALDDAGVPHVGTGEDVADGLKPVTFDTGEFRIAFMGLATALAPGAAAGEAAPRYRTGEGVHEIRRGSHHYSGDSGGRAVCGDDGYERRTSNGPAVPSPRRGDGPTSSWLGSTGAFRSGGAPLNQGELATYQQPLGRALDRRGGRCHFRAPSPHLAWCRDLQGPSDLL